jgi:hypothetical protein
MRSCVVPVSSCAVKIALGINVCGGFSGSIDPLQIEFAKQKSQRRMLEGICSLFALS